MTLTKKQKLDNAISEADRFLKKAKAQQKEHIHENRNSRLGGTYVYEYSSPKLSGATRRASMDLSRALSELRRYSG